MQYCITYPSAAWAPTARNPYAPMGATVGPQRIVRATPMNFHQKDYVGQEKKKKGFPHDAHLSAYLLSRYSFVPLP